LTLAFSYIITLLMKNKSLILSLLMAIVAFATSTGIIDGIQEQTAEASQYCLQCLVCGKQFPLKGDAPGRCPDCGFVKVIGKSGDAVVTDWARRVRCDSDQKSPASGNTGHRVGRHVEASQETSCMNVDKAANTLNALATGQPRGLCANHVQRALEAAGVSGEGHPIKARDYGRYLLSKGFIPLNVSGCQPEKGDVVVIQPASKTPDQAT
jgi:DNA-directed RNA polymerase subunit RPC12/RpoP